MKVGDKLPQVTFQTRVRDESVGGPNPFRWEPVTTDDYFKGKRVVLFSLPGAFTPTWRWRKSRGNCQASRSKRKDLSGGVHGSHVGA